MRMRFWFTGKKCDVNLDDCIAHACQNNGTCIDDVNGYICNCGYGFTGELCEIAMGTLTYGLKTFIQTVYKSEIKYLNIVLLTKRK